MFFKKFTGNYFGLLYMTQQPKFRKEQLKNKY